MEIFFYIVIAGLLSCCLVAIISMSKKIESILASQELLRAETLESLCANIDAIELKTVKISGQLDSFQDETHRSLLALRDALETTKPIKPNNWDSVKEAFKGPVRIEINERN